MRAIDLEETKSISLEILVNIDAFCRARGLRYYIAAGTLLGAVRHGGFIPWDDDIDVAMPREDYEEFYRSFPKENKNPNLRLISSRDRTFISPFFKVVDERTTTQANYLNPKYFTGIWVDIFPIDGLSESDHPFRKVERLGMLNSWFIANPEGASTPLRKHAKKVITPLIQGVDIYRHNAKADAVASAHPITKGSDVARILYGYGPRERMPYEFLDSIDMEFEGKTVLAPRIYDHYLTAIYGDYLTPLPPSERVPHTTAAFWK